MNGLRNGTRPARCGGRFTSDPASGPGPPGAWALPFVPAPGARRTRPATGGRSVARGTGLQVERGPGPEDASPAPRHLGPGPSASVSHSPGAGGPPYHSRRAPSSCRSVRHATPRRLRRGCGVVRRRSGRHPGYVSVAGGPVTRALYVGPTERARQALLGGGGYAHLVWSDRPPGHHAHPFTMRGPFSGPDGYASLLATRVVPVW